jgi:hypothetical protein
MTNSKDLTNEQIQKLNTIKQNYESYN